MSKVTLLILAVVLVVLFIVSVTVRIGDGSVDRASAGDEYPWMGGIDGLFGWMAPDLDLTSLACNGQPVASVFQLTAQGAAEAKCQMAVAADGEVDYRRAELRVLGGVSQLLVLAKCGEGKAVSQRTVPTLEVVQESPELLRSGGLIALGAAPPTPFRAAHDPSPPTEFLTQSR